MIGHQLLLVDYRSLSYGKLLLAPNRYDLCILDACLFILFLFRSFEEVEEALVIPNKLEWVDT
tara:strand:+ start:228 stop:416 length:189 start_codon:yes stop_codon:yes gene_type:complete